jgi:hypothetical protein
MWFKAWPAASLGDIGIIYANAAFTVTAPVTSPLVVKRYMRSRKNGTSVKTHTRRRRRKRR